MRRCLVACTLLTLLAATGCAECCNWLFPGPPCHTCGTAPAVPVNPYGGYDYGGPAAAEYPQGGFVAPGPG